jgi:acyl carrier protein
LPTAFVAPHNSTQAKLERIWAEVLFLDRVGIHDNFFDLGGHSLAASSVISRVIKSFQLELPVKALFDAPTIAEMAKVILGNDAKRATEENLKLGLDEIEAMTEEEADRQLAEKK